MEEFTGARSTTIASQQVTLGERSSASGRNQALAWLSERYQALGLTVKIRDYSSGKNFSAELPGSDPSRLLMVSSHYDTVNTVGADDNGAGTIAALLIAKALVNSGNVPTVLFVAFDQEERGLIGSKAMAKQMNASGELRNLDGVINLEMFGYDSDSDGAYHSIHCNENDSKILSDQFDKLVVEAGLPLKRVNACTNRSDHASFWAYDKPAIIISQNFFGGDANPCYHKACDQTKIINWDYYHRLTRASAGLARHFSQGTSVH